MINTLRKMALMLTIALATIMPAVMNAENKTKLQMPDFRYPETVAEDAEKDLKEALKSNNQNDAVASLIKIGLARTMVTERAAQDVINTIDSVISTGALTADHKALLWLVEGLIWKSVDRRYDMDGNAQQKAEEALRRSIDPLGNGNTECLMQPIGEYQGIIAPGNRLGNRCVPRLYDFLALQYMWVLRNDRTAQDEFADRWMDMHIADEDIMPRLYIDGRDLLGMPNMAYRYVKNNESAKKLYEKYAEHKESALFLRLLVNDVNEYETLCKYIERFPHSRMSEDIRRMIAMLEMKKASVRYQKVWQTKDSIIAYATLTNVEECTLTLYKVPDEMLEDEQIQISTSMFTKLESQIVTAKGTVPFTADDVRAAFSPQGLGRYIVLASYETSEGTQKVKQMDRYDIERNLLVVSDLRQFHVENRIIAVNSHSGQPEKDALIEYTSRGKTDKNKTNGDGWIMVPESYNQVNAKLTKADDRYLPEAYHNLKSYRPNSEQCISIQTDLSIYRPGETVRMSLVAYDQGISSRKPLKKVSLNVAFMDAAGNDINKQKVKTDDFGQAVCEFQIPTDRMNGRFSIMASFDDKDLSGSGYHDIEVSEYKTPTFYVDLEETSATQPAGGQAHIRGCVKTYSGLPVADTEVECTIDPQIWWLWGNDNSLEEQTFTVTTDSHGCFEYICPKEWTETDSSRPVWMRSFYVFYLKAEATNTAGETQSSHKTFRMGNSHYIDMASESTCMIVPKAKTRLPFYLVSTDPEDTSVECHYTLRNHEGQTIDEGHINTLKPEADWNHIASGRYTLTIGIDGEPEEKDAKGDVILYRETDTKAPVESAMWMPVQSRYVVANGTKARMLIGSASDTFIYYIASSRSKIMSQGWLHYGAGMHWLELPMPNESNQVLDIRFFAVHEGEMLDQSASFTSPIADKVQITAVSFRNKIAPGTHEHWTFALTDGDGKPVKGRMVFELYNQALHNLMANDWHFTSHFGKLQISAHMQQFFGSANTHAPHYFNWEESDYIGNGTAINIPLLQLYGQNFMQRRNDHTRFMSRLLNATGSVMAALADTEETAEVAYGAQKAALQYDSATNDQSADGAMNRSFDDIELRTDEVKVALWLPQLTSDADGNIHIEFDAPNFNTTWRLQALAYDKTMASSIMHDKVLAQRPVMVQPSLPRFLRAGDVTRLAANVMNASDKEQNVHTLIEIFNPRTDEVILSEACDIVLAPESTQAVFISCSAPLDAPYIGFRIRAIDANGNGDGEQQMLPVLTDLTPVIETLPFYQHPGDNNLVLEVGVSDSHGGTDSSRGTAMADRLVFEFCNNPVWYCVTALPTIANSDNVTSIGLAHSLYAMALASKFASDNPAVLDAISEWKAMTGNGTDSPLVSQLSKNDDLKIGSLLASPWLPEAERQELRMSQLDKLFSDASNEKAFSQLIGKLETLRRSDGGFAWIDDSNCPFSDHKSSYWTTCEVAQLIGELWHLGCLTDDARLNDLMQSAIRYIDSETIRLEDDMLAIHGTKGKGISRKDNPSYLGFRHYLYIRSLFSDIAIAPSLEKRIHTLCSNTLKSIESEWGSLSVPEKAYCAIILHRNQRSQQARRVTESIRQFAVKDPHRGMYWERIERSSWQHPVACTSVVLQALAEVDGRQEEIDMIRQWMLLEKQTSDWGGSSLAADAVYSLLTTGTEWLHPGKQQASALPDNGVTLIADGKGIELPATDSHLGYFRIDLPADTRHIEVTRTGHNPAWGSLYHQYVGRMAEVKAASVPEVSIQKQIIISGNHAEVQLTVICDKALEYVTIRDERPAFLEPDDQLSGFHWGKEFYYLETKDSETRLFCTRLSEGRHVFTYRCSVTNAGTFTSGIATVQSQYAPQFTAHSEGEVITIGTGNH